jgi:multidrug efflux pump subunit AcrB
VVQQAAAIIERTTGVAHSVAFAGLHATMFTDASNNATIFSKLAPFGEGVGHGLKALKVLELLRLRLSAIRSAFVLTVAPPPIQGIGNAGGFK